MQQDSIDSISSYMSFLKYNQYYKNYCASLSNQLSKNLQYDLQFILLECFGVTSYVVVSGGSLAEYVEEHRRTGTNFTEEELKTILYQTAQGLRYVHSQNLVHLDIKPGNVFIHRNPKLLQSPESGLESCEEEEEFEEPIIYKIGAC